MTTPPTPSPTDLDRLAAEALGPLATDMHNRGLWHPTQSHDQCQLLVDEVVKRGLVQFYVDELLGIDPLPANATGQGVRAMSRAFQYLATAPAYDKCLAATRVLMQKGETK